MTKKMNNHLLNQLDKQAAKRHKIEIETTLGNAEVLINLYFSEGKINKMANDLLETVKPLLASDEIEPENLASPFVLLPVFILRTFSNLPIPKENDLDILSQVNDRLIEHGIVRQVFQQFNETEVTKAIKGVEELLKAQNMLNELYSKAMLQSMEHSKV